MLVGLEHYGMTRVKRGLFSAKYARKKKVMKFTKGFKGSHSTLFRTANQQAMKALRYAYIDRRKVKREFRKLWIQRINAAARSHPCLSYSSFIYELRNEYQIYLNRKILAELVILEPIFAFFLFNKISILVQIKRA
jgi:large subunit ribosomal protein L20